MIAKRTGATVDGLAMVEIDWDAYARDKKARELHFRPVPGRPDLAEIVVVMRIKDRGPPRSPS